MAERVDAGGGRVPDNWEGLVTELGHDLSGHRPRPQAYRQPDAVSTTASVTGGGSFLDQFRPGATGYASDRREGIADRRVEAGSAPDGEERRVGVADRRVETGFVPDGSEV